MRLSTMMTSGMKLLVSVMFWIQLTVDVLSFAPTAPLLPHLSSRDFSLAFQGGSTFAMQHLKAKFLKRRVASVGNLLSSRTDSTQPSNDTADMVADDNQLIQFQQQSIIIDPISTLLDPVDQTPFTDDSSASAVTVTTLSSDQSSQNTSTLTLWQGRTIVIGAAAIYGTNFAAIKLLDPVIPLAASAAIRFTLAAAAVTPLVLWNEASKKKDLLISDESSVDWEPWWLGGEVGAWYCIGYLCQAWGLHWVDASKSAFYTALAVIVVPLLDAIFKQKRLGLTGIVSVVTAMIGVALLETGPSPAAMSTIPSDAASLIQLGDLVCLSQAIFFGIGYWRLEAASTKYPNESGPITSAQLLAIAAGSVAYWVASSGVDFPSYGQILDWLSDPFILSAVTWTGLVSTALALWLETVALSVVSATELTILMTSVSLWGSLFAYLTIGETLSTVGMLGGVLILSGCVLTSLEKQVTTDIPDVD